MVMVDGHGIILRAFGFKFVIVY